MIYYFQFLIENLFLAAIVTIPFALFRRLRRRRRKERFIVPRGREPLIWLVYYYCAMMFFMGVMPLHFLKGWDGWYGFVNYINLIPFKEVIEDFRALNGNPQIFMVNFVANILFLYRWVS